MEVREGHDKLEISLSDWSSLTCSLIWVYDCKVPRLAYRRQIVPNKESLVWLLRKGEATVRTEKQEWHIQPGEWFCLPEVAYSQDFSRDAEMLSIRFKASWVTGIPIFHHGDGILIQAVDYPQLDEHVLPLRKSYELCFPDQVHNLLAVSATPSQYFKLQYYLMLWLHAYAETLLAEGRVPTRLSPMDPRMLAVARDLDSWPLHVPLDEEGLAHRLNLSTRQLARLFKIDFGRTPNGYYHDRKLLSAKSALHGQESTVKEIAFEHGFKSLSHFSTWFRKQCGQSPRDYRTAHEKA